MITRPYVRLVISDSTPVPVVAHRPEMGTPVPLAIVVPRVFRESANRTVKNKKQIAESNHLELETGPEALSLPRGSRMSRSLPRLKTLLFSYLDTAVGGGRDSDD